MCVNTPGSFMCICHTGYIRIDDYSCTGELLHWPFFFFDRLESSGAGADVTPSLRASASRATILCGGFASSLEVARGMRGVKRMSDVVCGFLLQEHLRGEASKYLL